MTAALTPEERLAKYLNLLGYLCLVLSALQVWEYYSFSTSTPSFLEQIKTPRFYNILYVFMMSAFAGTLLIHRPKLGVIVFHVLSLSEMLVLLLLNNYVGGGKNAAAAFFVVGLLFYYKLVAKIKLKNLKENDSKKSE